ncbi:MAG: hypothetical protein JWL86_5073 [Rhizobium sp.]|nr:hypothetical protein [Rhizobium sp.]
MPRSETIFVNFLRSLVGKCHIIGAFGGEAVEPSLYLEWAAVSRRFRWHESQHSANA